MTPRTRMLILIVTAWWQSNTGYLLCTALGSPRTGICSAPCALPGGEAVEVFELIGHWLLHAAEHQALARFVTDLVAGGIDARASLLASLAALVSSRSLVAPVPPWTLVAIALGALPSILISAPSLIGVRLLRPPSIRTS